jgi:NTP pyrophosphatase (non-canonical NTP hydrolase)
MSASPDGPTETVTRYKTLRAVNERMVEQASRADIPDLFSFTRNGLRMSIASIEDETGELYEEWLRNKRNLGNAVHEIRHELLDIAAVALHAYEQVT